MKSKKTTAKGKTKIKGLKLSKQTLKNLSDHDAAAVKGGAAVKCATDPDTYTHAAR